MEAREDVQAAPPVPGVDVPLVKAAADIVIADCCAPGGDYQYMRIAGRWHQIGWIAVATKGRTTTWRSFANPACACQACGHDFGDATPNRRYHAGAFEPVDDIVDAVLSKAAKAREAGHEK